jgi:alkyl sulfatase BDS1-like metallo-beta-lactamase superfamily hydrolase
MAGSYTAEGDLRFAAELLDRVVFADPGHQVAKEQLAQVYERLAHGSENGTWRNFYLMGAHELRHGVDALPLTVGSVELLSALTVGQLLDAIAVRVVGSKAWNERLTIDWRFTDLGETHRATLGNGVLTHRVAGEGATPADLTLVLTKPQMLGVLVGAGLEGIGTEGDLGVIGRLLEVIEVPDRNFPIVTP